MLRLVLIAGLAAGAGATGIVRKGQPPPRRARSASAQTQEAGGVVHMHYIAADPLSWDYVPGGTNGMTGKPLNPVGYFMAPDGKVITKPVRTAYAKCLYREYTDDTFQALKPRPAQWQHLGMMGPLLRGTVGDTIRVVFRNNCGFPASMHPHGVFYDKNSEGSVYDDGQGSPHPGDAVAPGATYTYTWLIPPRAGPGPGDGNSVMWMYHSHVNELRDFDAGLVGPMIITARGQAKADGTPMGVDRELVMWFSQIHEEDSWLVHQNLPTIDTDHAIPTPLTPSSATVTYPYFVTFSINGYSFSSMPRSYLTMRKGEHVRWYLMSGLNDFDFHTPHWHGNTVVINGMRTDVTAMGPMQMVVADMEPDDPGTWLFHCHVAFHNELGMNVQYTVLP
ncbi:MAG: multicopper oxidase domain-containing protein [Acidobacteriota bacterium]|nr:multicopper oxidase domain-containing protein [Acidobacteriota bacterium]